MQSMKFLAMGYKEALDSGKVPNNIIEEAQNRIKLAVAAMFGAAINKQYDNSKLVDELKSEGLYPYKLYWGFIETEYEF